jgi:hypothetical protein
MSYLLSMQVPHAHGSHAPKGALTMVCVCTTSSFWECGACQGLLFAFSPFAMQGKCSTFHITSGRIASHPDFTYSPRHPCSPNTTRQDLDSRNQSIYEQWQTSNYPTKSSPWEFLHQCLIYGESRTHTNLMHRKMHSRWCAFTRLPRWKMWRVPHPKYTNLMHWKVYSRRRVRSHGFLFEECKVTKTPLDGPCFALLPTYSSHLRQKTAKYTIRLSNLNDKNHARNNDNQTTCTSRRFRSTHFPLPWTFSLPHSFYHGQCVCVKDQPFADSFLHTRSTEFVNVVILSNLQDHCAGFHTQENKGCFGSVPAHVSIESINLAVVRHRKTKGVLNQFSNE